MMRRFLPLLFLPLVCCRAVSDMDVPVPSPDELPDLLMDAIDGDAEAEEVLEFWSGRNDDGVFFALAAAAEARGDEDGALEYRKRSAREDAAPFGRISAVELLVEDAQALRRPLQVLDNWEEAEGPSMELLRARVAVLEAEDRMRLLSALHEDAGSARGEDWFVPAAAAVLMRNRFADGAEAEAFVYRVQDGDSLRSLTDVRERLPSEAARQLLDARTAYAAGDMNFASAAFTDWLNDVLETSPEEDVLAGLKGAYPAFFAELAEAARETGEVRLWADRLTDAAGELTGVMRFGSAYAAGMLYRAAGDYDRAAGMFALAASVDSIDELAMDRALWYRIRSLQALPGVSVEADSAFVETADLWNRAERFDDAAAEFLYRSVRWGRWSALAAAYRDKAGFWSDSFRADAAWTLGYAVREGRVPGERSAEDYFRDAYRFEPFSWAGLRSAGVLGLELSAQEELFEAPARFSGDPRMVEDARAVLDLYLRWGLLDTAYAQMMFSPELYSTESVRRLSDALAAENPRRSIHVAGLLMRWDGFRPNPDDLRRRYPLPLEDLARKAADEYELSPEILFGLVRTESAWDAQAASRSGAIGLGQFMPATWEEWTARLKYPADSDPRDPETNLMYSAAYVTWLMEREWTSGWTDTLVSYNAGGGRLRSWRRERPGFGEDLFGISVPVAEPRYYVRKVLSAATIYGYLYGSLSPGEMHRSWGLN